MTHSVYDVFTPARQATLSFVERPSVNDVVVDALQTPGKQLVLYGESGSGKSTLIKRKLEQLFPRHIVTQCTSNATFVDLLLDAFDKLSPFYVSGRTSSKVESASAGASFANIQASLNASRQDSETLQRAVATQLSPQRLAELLGASETCWVVDDFHKVPNETKDLLAKTFKIFCDLAADAPLTKIVAIGATDTARQVVEFEPEMRNRVAEIFVPLMTREETEEILSTGGRLMNVDFSAIRDDVVTYAVGVASVCHQLALNACVGSGILASAPQVIVLDGSSLALAVSAYVAQSSDSLKATFERALIRRRHRKYDNCGLILAALASGPLEGMRNVDIVARIQSWEPSYKSANMQVYLKELAGDERGPVIRTTPNGVHRFLDPLHHTYAQLTLLPKQDVAADVPDPITAFSTGLLANVIVRFVAAGDAFNPFQLTWADLSQDHLPWYLTYKTSDIRWGDLTTTRSWLPYLAVDPVGGDAAAVGDDDQKAHEDEGSEGEPAD